MSPLDKDSTLPMRAADVGEWWVEHDVVVVGFGGAGACAAIEAARAGADTLVLERMMAGGGTTAFSTGVIYLGAGTRVQEACGFPDSVEEMRKHVRLAAGEHADDEKIRLFCESSVEHFGFLCDLGVEFRDAYVAEKTTHPFDDACLFYSGNELAYPFASQAIPAPRGHKPARSGEAGGHLMERLIAGAENAGANVVTECRVRRLIVDGDSRVVGVAATHERSEVCIRARRGVILCAGGFVMNDEMLTRHAPWLLECNWKAATEGDDGTGINIGVGAGADAVNMDEGLVLNAYYPPESHLKGIIVDAQGERIVNEDAYLGRTSDAMIRKAGGKAWLIVDNEICGRAQGGHKLAAVEENIADLERSLAMPQGRLVRTVEHYNAHAAKGEDPEFHKASAYLRPLTSTPFAALDCSTDNSIYGVLTLGGLATRATGEVLAPDGEPIAGLYAAGRNTAGICLEGRTYASGLSIADATFFGRLAGARAAAAS